MLKPRAIELRARLWATHRRAPGLAAPPAGVVAFALDDRQPKGFAQAIGFEVLGSACLRIDIVERLGAGLRALARAGPFALEPELMALTGLGQEQLGEVVEALGYARDGERYVRRRARAPRGAPAPRRKPESSASPFAVLRRFLVNE
jgi:ATP-dependent RNA helicase SUPV3L1/SUV3